MTLKDLISRQQAIDALDRIGSLDTEADKKYARSVFEALPSAQPETHDKHTETHACDLISRRAAIDEGMSYINGDCFCDKEDFAKYIEFIERLPPIQPEPCEYAVSRQTLKDGFTEMCNLICPYSKKQQHVMCGSCLMGTAFDVLEATPPVTPKQRTGKWIKLDMHRGMADHKCTACGQECYVPTCMGEPLYAFCPNCGADMRDESDE